MTHLFFDLGSTLIDESLCHWQRAHDTVAGSNISIDAFTDKIHEFASQNKNAYTCAREFFRLPKAPWRHDLERLFPGVPELLEGLSTRFSLGILANQAAGLENRLRQLQIGPYFSVILGSGNFGASKPDQEIFLEALRLANCAPEQAWMIGDRLDNDILPAQTIGMHTIWVRQGFGAYGNPDLLSVKPDYIIDSITQISSIFLSGVSPM